MAKYARIGADLTVLGWVSIDDPSSIPQHKKWSDGGLFIRPVQEEAPPSYNPSLASLQTTTTVEPSRVVISYSVVSRPLVNQKQAVKDEAGRRILARYPEWKQANMTARAVELQDIWRQVGSWTGTEQAEADAITEAWAWVKSIRQRSNEIEALTPIPDDYDSDARWVI